MDDSAPNLTQGKTNDNNDFQEVQRPSDAKRPRAKETIQDRLAALEWRDRQILKYRISAGEADKRTAKEFRVGLSTVYIWKARRATMERVGDKEQRTRIPGGGRKANQDISETREFVRKMFSDNQVAFGDVVSAVKEREPFTKWQTASVVSWVYRTAHQLNISLLREPSASDVVDVHTAQPLVGGVGPLLRPPPAALDTQPAPDFLHVPEGKMDERTFAAALSNVESMFEPYQGAT